MNRRKFNALLAASAVAPWQMNSEQQLLVDGRRLNRNLTSLSEFGRNELGGVDRVAYSEADREARDFAIHLMEGAGLSVRIDTAGNIIGSRSGADPALSILALGSHIDSVPQGGNYDGDVGAMAAIEVATTLNQQDVSTRHPMEFTIFANEEGGQTGARGMSGRLSDADLERVSSSGKALREGIAFIGGDPDRIREARRQSDELKHYLELHIEQGPILASEGIDIGVVEGIVGIHRWMVTFDGYANHAGTTPMDQRRDALLAAARFIQIVNETVTSVEGRQVGTVGWIEAEPGAPNVVPGRVRLTLEMRDLDWPKIDRLFASMQEQAAAIEQESGVRIGFQEIYDNPPRLTDPHLQDVVRRSCRNLDLSFQLMPSGAGHDAQSLSHIVSVGMIFIPSRGGISHSADEYSSPEDITNGANVLLHSLLSLDG